MTNICLNCFSSGEVLPLTHRPLLLSFRLVLSMCADFISAEIIFLHSSANQMLLFFNLNHKNCSSGALSMSYFVSCIFQERKMI